MQARPALCKHTDPELASQSVTSTPLTVRERAGPYLWTLPQDRGVPSVEALPWPAHGCPWTGSGLLALERWPPLCMPLSPTARPLWALLTPWPHCGHSPVLVLPLSRLPASLSDGYNGVPSLLFVWSALSHPCRSQWLPNAAPAQAGGVFAES